MFVGDIVTLRPAPAAEAEHEGKGMELDDQSFLEELLALRRDAFDSDALLFSCFADDLSHLAGNHQLPPPPVDLPPTFYSPFPSPEAVPPLPPPAPLPANRCPPTRIRKAEGQPSKNLMAERRRRKRLNDRLSMLRSVVPKISKMDRTSILGDTIEYMKELLERIKLLQAEMEVDGEASLGGGVRRDPNENLVRNAAPQFEVERREGGDTRVEICCAGKPGLLLSTVGTLEALGLEIQQCVVSCFNDFGMQASCSEDSHRKAAVAEEDIKQALFHNAGYGGRCM